VFPVASLYDKSIQIDSRKGFPALTLSQSGCDATASVAAKQAHMQQNTQQNDLPSETDPSILIVLDTETTGLDHKTEQLIEVAAVRLVNGDIQDTFTALIKPTVPIRHSSYRIHHISEEMVADAPSAEEVIPQLLAFINGAPFVAHNAVFDYSFISEAHKKIYDERWTTRKIDTLDMFRQVFPEEPSHGLSALLARFGFEPEVTHRALDDAMCLAKVYPKLRALYEQRYAWQFNQLSSLDYLVERYLRLQKAIQVMQSEMSDLKQVFKLHFNEGGKPVKATTGDLMVSSTRRSYEYDDDKVWPLILESGLVQQSCKLNPRQLDKLIVNDTVDDDIRSGLKAARTNMSEFRAINFVKPNASDDKADEQPEI